MRGKHRLVALGRVLTAAVGMMHYFARTRRRPAPGAGHRQRRKGQFGPQMIGHRPADDPPRPRLAQVGQWHGWRARYRGRRTNLSDLRRVVVVHNPHRWARRGAGTDAAAA